MSIILNFLVYFYLVFIEIAMSLSTNSFNREHKFAKIMTMDSNNNEGNSNSMPLPFPTAIPVPSLPVNSPIPTRLPMTTQINILTPSPTSSSIMPNRNGISKTIEKCNEYHDWIIKHSTFQFFIIKGTPVIEKEFPHMAALGYGSENIQWLCGGSLISEQYVLTAAHCLKSLEMGPVKWARLGENDLNKSSSETMQMFSVIERIEHPEYSSTSKYNDIALLKLERPVEFSEYVLPICLSTSNNDVEKTLVATGWGKTMVNGVRSDRLLKVELEHFPNNVCRAAYADVSKKDLPQGVIEEKQVCAGSTTDQRDTCQGDSGGPLQINTDKLYLIGITSIGKMCGIPNVPAIYTRVINYIPWIESIVWG